MLSARARDVRGLSKSYSYAFAGLVVACGLVLATLSAGAQSSIGWSGDFETGNFSQWVYGVQQSAAGRASIVTSPVRQGRYAARFEVDPGDVNVGGHGERTEALIDTATTGGYPGREQWWAWSTMFAPDFTSVSTNDWNFFTQFHHTGSTGQPNVHFSADGSYLRFKVCNGSDPSSPSCRAWTIDSNRQNAKWYDFVFHVKWSSDPTVGFVEVWENGHQVVPTTHIATLYPGEGVYLKQGYYRVSQPNVAVLYIDGTRRGDSYQDVVAGFPAGTWPASPDGTVALPNPSISGSPIVGATLTASVDTSGLPSSVASSVAYQWRRCDASGGSCQNIAGATSASYTVASGDASSTLRVVATVQASSGPVSSTSGPTGVVAASDTLPLPTITGTAAVGNVLVAFVDTTGLSADAVGLGYQWLRCDTTGASCSPITGATSSLYTVASADAGSTLRVRATVQTSTGPISSTSLPTATVPAETTPTTATAPPATVSNSLAAGDTISGVYDWTVTTSGACAKVEFWATPSGLSPIKLGEVVGTSGSYVFHFDTTTLNDGSYLFGVVEDDPAGVRYKDGNRVTATIDNGQPTQFSVGSSIANGQTLSGQVKWTAQPSVVVTKVVFSIDGSNSWTENLSPYVFNGDTGMLDTTTLPDGDHTFIVKAFAADGSTTSTSATAKVANSTTPAPTSASGLSVSSSIGDGQTLSGRVSWTAGVGNSTPTKVEFYIDGSLEWTERLSPYVFDGDGNTLDTTTMSDGNHAFAVKAYASDGSVASVSATAKVSNAAAVPPSPSPSPPLPTQPVDVSSSISDGAVLSGQVSWTANASGSIAKVDFYIDGSLKWTERLTPYVYDGDGGKLDTANARNGKHTLLVKAFGTDGSTASATANVRFKN